MRRRGTRALLLLLCLALPLCGGAIDVSVSAVVPSDDPPTPADTVVIFRGLAYPGSQVTVERQGTILVTAPADPGAHFDISVGNQPAGIFTYAVYAEDSRGQVGRTSNFTLSITASTTTTVSGIFLGPTIGADKTTTQLDQTITLLGVTAPDSAVTIFVSSEEEKTFNATAGADGLWVRQLLGTDIGVGDHTARAKAVAPNQSISAFSNSVAFAITDAPATPCTGKNRADLNCDGRVNLTDFSILLFFWRKTNPSNARADINTDGVVNLTDVSILLFNFNR